MPQIETWVGCDLDKAVQVRQLGGFLFTQDNEGNLLGAKVTQDGEPVNLTGTVVGYAILADGQTVDITGDSTGIHNGNEAFIILPQLAYSVPGQISIVIKLTTADTITTLAAFCGYVYRSKTGNEVVPPGTPIPDLSTLEEAIRNANTAATAANTAAVAAENVDIAMSQDGDVITITTTDRQGETQTATLTDQSEAVSELKSAFTQLDANVITESAGPAPIISIADGADGMPMRKVEVAIEPVQDLRGYEYPWPAGGGKNLVNVEDQIGITSGTKTVAEGLPTGDYLTASADISDVEPTGGTARIRLQYEVDGRLTISSNSMIASGRSVATLQIPENATAVKAVVQRPGTVTSFSAKNIMVERGQMAGEYSPYSNVCPISGWTGAKVTRTGVNVWDEEWELGAYNTATGVPQASTTGIRNKNAINVKPGANYSIVKPTTSQMYALFYDANGAVIQYVKGASDTASVYNASSRFSQSGDFYTFTVPYGAVTMNLRIDDATTYANNISINYPATDTSYHTGSVLSVQIPFGQTVYGGTLDVASGKLVVDRAVLNTTWGAGGSTTEYDDRTRKRWELNPAQDLTQTASALCNLATYQNGTAPLINRFSFNATQPYFYLSLAKDTDEATPIQVCYRIANPQEITLSPTEITTLLGINNVFADCGDTSIEYPANTKLYIDRKITEAVANALNA